MSVSVSGSLAGDDSQGTSWRTDTVGRFLVFSTHLHDLLFCIFPISNSKGNPGRVACQNGHTLDFLISMFYRGEADTKGLVSLMLLCAPCTSLIGPRRLSKVKLCVGFKHFGTADHRR